MCRLAKNHYPASICIFLFSFFLFIHKALTLNSLSRRITTTGETVNLMAVDAQRVMHLVETLNQLWSAPFQICVAIYFLYVTMGVAVLAGLGTLLLLVPLNLLITRLVRKMQVTWKKRPSEKTWREKISVVIKIPKRLFLEMKVSTPPEIASLT